MTAPNDNQIFHYISTEFAAVRERLDGISRDNAAVLQEIKSINREQHRQAERIDRLEKDTREKMEGLERAQIDMAHTLSNQKTLSERIDSMEVELKDLRAWKATKQSSWLGPKNVLAAIGTLVPIVALVSGGFQILRWFTG